MLFYYMYRESHIKYRLIAFIFLCNSVIAQEDSLCYVRYKLNPVLYTDLGFNAAPIKIRYDFNDEIHRLHYKNNMSAVWGWGFAYKWFALRFGITLPGNLRPVSQYGKTQYYDMGFDFSIKRSFTDIDFHSYNGYAIKDAYRWNDTLNDLRPHEIRSNINSTSFSINTWLFKSPQFKMQAFRGKTGLYNKDVHSFYTKFTFNIHGVSSFDSLSIIPYQLVDTNKSKTKASDFRAADWGFVPGMAYVKRWKSFQFGGMGGLGLVVQSKFYNIDGYRRGFLGLAPRYDIKIIAGYNVPRYFLMFVADFDNKSIRFNDLVYRQTYYSIKLVGGIRFNKREKENKKSSRQD